MKLALFDGQRPGLVDGDVVVDLSSLLPTPSVAGAWSDWLDAHGDFAGVADLELADLPRSSLASVVLDAPLPRPGKLIAAPVNYLDHKIEMSEQKTIAEYGLFLKATSSVLAPGGTVELPYTDKRTDQEGELGVLIGRRARSVPPGNALSYVAGYTGVLDISVRSTEDRSTRKSFDTFTPIGPWIVTPDEVGDADSLRLDCWVGGDHRQSVSTADMIFDVAQLVAYASSVMTLWPGDVIASGTPAGVGPLSDGQVIELEIERIGRLVVNVSGRTAVAYAERPLPAL
ncbi:MULTISPECIES: fumarylacetoacetate hydrolase family protein [unclassified Microbacterium]|uniref:fumarylacetoacetate hydrolase family protein n=1 Tax=unclassified Microbacterium TaxID=2609290 RepID=UPI000EA95C17|nr:MULTISPECIES: fumarylacetoacetate hydrolase family protein [unclassified Microbacterium]MBT2486472.1 fumarylacetoacetate hydrolase family protein [Microbacterium sp. ISL-108]RKN69170.1 FAA hydrolase family protein [Microbacterium sp. CGR2]